MHPGGQQTCLALPLLPSHKLEEDLSSRAERKCRRLFFSPSSGTFLSETHFYLLICCPRSVYGELQRPHRLPLLPVLFLPRCPQFCTHCVGTISVMAGVCRPHFENHSHTGKAQSGFSEKTETGMNAQPRSRTCAAVVVGRPQ